MSNLQKCQKTLDKLNAFQPYKRERDRERERGGRDGGREAERGRERESVREERPVDDSLTEPDET